MKGYVAMIEQLVAIAIGIPFIALQIIIIIDCLHR